MATGPTKAHGLLPVRKKGKDSKRPSVRPIHIPLEPTEQSPPRSRVPLGSAGQSPPRSRVAELPSSRRPISASLEGSGYTLERVPYSLPRSKVPQSRNAPPPRSRVADLPSSGVSSPPRSRPSFGTKDKRLRRPTARRTKAFKASHSTTAQRTGGVRPPLPQ